MGVISGHGEVGFEAAAAADAPPPRRWNRRCDNMPGFRNPQMESNPAVESQEAERREEELGTNKTQPSLCYAKAVWVSND